jgi:hypothetical protein
MSAKSLAAVLSAAVGLYAIILGIQGFASVVTYSTLFLQRGFGGSLGAAGWLSPEFLKLACTMSAVPVILITLGVILVVHPPRRLWSLAQDPDGPPAPGGAGPMVLLTVGMTLIGTYFLAGAAPRVIMHLARSSGLFSKDESSYMSYLSRPEGWLIVAQDVAQLLIGAYLFFGARSICRWLMKRMLAREYFAGASYGQDYPPPPQDQA